MKTPKQRYINIMEKYLNVLKKEQVELMYGESTKIKIKRIDYITQGKYIMLEVVIILGATINEEVMDRTLVDYLIEDIITLMFPDHSYSVVLSWDA